MSGSEGQPIPNAPEAPKPGVTISFKQPDLIRKAAKDGKSGSLGEHLLPTPIHSIKLDLVGYEDTFDLELELELDRDASPSPNRDGKIRRQTAEQFGEIEENGGNLLITTKRGNSFVFSGPQAGMPDQGITITTGFKRKNWHEQIRLADAPSTDQEAFDSVLADLKDMTEATIVNLYGEMGRKGPDREISFTPPKEKRGGSSDSDYDFEGKSDFKDKFLVEKPNVSFEDIGGQENAKREAKGLVLSLKRPELYKKWGTKPPKGILFHGPPGVGKTLLAEAIATEADARFLPISAADIGAQYYGQSERLMQAVFDTANEYDGNVIIFIDELDALAPQRDQAHEATQKVLSILLQNLDGLHSRPNVMIIGTTNRLTSIDPALTRAGRFDRWVELELPDKVGRRQIIEINMRSAQEEAERQLFAPDLDIEILLHHTENYNGADIKEVIRRVLEEKLRHEALTGEEPGPVTTNDIILQTAAYEKVKRQKNEMHEVGFRAHRRLPGE